jgi:hypothetical protein
MQLTFDGVGLFNVPSITASAGSAAFVSEGSPIPVLQHDTSGTLLLKAKKFAVLTSFTKESTDHSIPNLELLVRQKLLESTELQLDARMLDAEAASVLRPAGLRNGIAALTASDETIPSEAMDEDASALIGAVSTVARNNPILLIAAPQQAARLARWNRSNNFGYEVLSSGGLSAGFVIAIASNCLASAIGPPRFEIANAATLHFEDTTPLGITTESVAATVKSTWQTDSISLRLIMEISFGLRSASGLAWTQSVLW